MIAVKVLCLVLCASILHAQPLDVREKRQVDSKGVVTFPETRVADEQNDDGPILSEADDTGTELARDERSPDDEYEDYGEDDPEGRHLHKIKRKLKRKFKPHKYQSFLGSALGGYGGHGGHGGHHHHHHHQHHGGYGGYDCRKLHGCGGFGGWQQPSYGGGPIATAIAGPSQYGGWNPGYGGYGNRPGGNAHAAAWNFGPFSIGLANAGK